MIKTFTTRQSLNGINEVYGMHLLELCSKKHLNRLGALSSLREHVDGDFKMLRYELDEHNIILACAAFKEYISKAFQVKKPKIRFLEKPIFVKEDKHSVNTYLTPSLVGIYEGIYFPLFVFPDDSINDGLFTNPSKQYVAWWCRNFNPDFMPLVYNQETDSFEDIKRVDHKDIELAINALKINIFVKTTTIFNLDNDTHEILREILEDESKYSYSKKIIVNYMKKNNINTILCEDVRVVYDTDDTLKIFEIDLAPDFK